MTIPRQLGPDTGPRTALPDYSRSTATVERMVAALRSGPGGRSGAATGPVRALFPIAALRDTALRAVVSALCCGGALVAAVGIVLLALSPEDGRSPGLGLLTVIASLGAMGLVLLLLGVRFGIVALGTARSRVEISEQGLRVRGAVRSRWVPWHDVIAVESRVVHPVHWLTAALRLRDGSRVLMPAFDRPIWAYAEPSGQDIRALRTELRRHQQAAQ